MDQDVSVKGAGATVLCKADAASPALVVTSRDTIAIKAGTIFNRRTFDEQTPIWPPAGGYVAGADYGVFVDATMIRATTIGTPPLTNETIIGGFHFAPGGNAAGRSGGDDVPAINPCSLWDVNFRPACPDPRGMALVEMRGLKFWADIYLLASDHLDGTSRFGVKIADGDDPPQKPGGGRFKKLDYETAVAVMKQHGKGLLSFEEFAAAAIGVTEKTACEGDPETTQLDAARTSRVGLMQATGNLWVWGHDGDPDVPRASIFGGSWWAGGYAGSRSASVACIGPDYSSGDLGARGRGDHLQLV